MPPVDIAAIEKKWQQYWEDKDIYTFNPDTKKKLYSIDTPPPTVSGEMHMGHAFMYSQMDFIARYRRMAGYNVFYPFGTDDNGLPTEKLIEKTKQVKSTKMSREEFIALCLDTLKDILPTFAQDWKDLGISCDYKKTYSTIDEQSRKISQQSFIELYKKGFITKKAFPTIWDVRFQTPVAQAELEDKEKDTFFSTINFRVEDTPLPIATTRPELLGACVAVFIHPENEQYNQWIGKKATVPLFENEVPIIADESADPKKGTGILMVCSYGDKYDVQAIEKHNLTPRVIISQDGKLTIDPYKDMPIKEARKKILADLEDKKLIIDQKKIKHTVNVFEKSGEEIEFIPTEQWFVNVLEMKKQLIAEGKKVQWLPEYMFKRYHNWVEGLEWDWSISRERHFGIPIPVWYDEEGSVILAEESELPVDPTKTKKKDPKSGKDARPETKVLDTWATSSLTPTIAAERMGAEITGPYSLRPQGHDIIRTWAFYTIVKSILHKNEIPWETIAVTGNVKLKGEKMSKSKGNVIRPQEKMQSFGADALRYWAASSKLGEDLEYHEKDVVTGKKFITKLMNATNFVFMNLEYQKTKPELLATDRMFMAQLNKLIATATDAFESYNYARAKLETEKFFFQVFADNYLEIIKKRIYEGTPKEKASASYSLYHALLTLCKLFAPITPYATEEVYQNHFKEYEKADSIHITKWPQPLPIEEHDEDHENWNVLLDVISKVRQAKSEAKKSMKTEIELTIPNKTHKQLQAVIDDVQNVTGATTITEGTFGVNFK